MKSKLPAFLFFLSVLSVLPVTSCMALADQPLSRPDARDLRAMTRDSGRAYPKENIAVASGVGWIREDTAQERLLARRAALLDARRNLLALRRKLLAGSRAKPELSGHVTAHRIFGERIKGNLYFLEVEVPLDELLEADFAVNFSVVTRLH